MKLASLWIAAGIALSVATAVSCGETKPVDFGDALPDGAIQIDETANKYKPAELTVHVLDTVYFTNGSTAKHTVIIGSKNESGDMERGDVFSWTFDEAGEYQILCGYHPQMKATITVKP